jgi:hypothetical protein
MSEINSDPEEKTLPKPKSDETILELQLGDVIQISNPLNDNLNKIIVVYIRRKYILN